MLQQIDLHKSAQQMAYKMLFKNNKGVKWLLVKIVLIIAAILFIGAFALFGISEYVKLSQTSRVYDNPDDISENIDIDCIVVLGAGLKADGTPNHMLEDRIKVGVDVLSHTGADYILMSGDRSDEYYDEPAAMKKYAESLGVDPSKIIIDNEGFSTFESITRVKEKYGFDNVVIVTQKYHLYRALYIAENSGIDSVGVSADLRTYRKQIIYSLREILARVKDFVWCI